MVVSKLDAAAELGRNPVSEHQIQPEYGDEQRGMGRLNPSHETKLSGTYGDRGIFIFPIQLTYCIGVTFLISSGVGFGIGFEYG